MVQIKFTASGANSMIGAFSSGDIARVSEDFARHLVEEARVATYLDVPAPAAVDPAKPPKPPRRKAAPKE